MCKKDGEMGWVGDYIGQEASQSDKPESEAISVLHTQAFTKGHDNLHQLLYLRNNARAEKVECHGV